MTGVELEFPHLTKCLINIIYPFVPIALIVDPQSGEIQLTLSVPKNIISYGSTGLL